MRIIPINNTGYYQRSLYSVNTNPSINKNNYNPQFKGFATSALVAIVAKSGVSAIKGSKIRRFLIDLNEHIHSSNHEKYKESVRALVKTPNDCKPTSVDVIEFFTLFLPNADVVYNVDLMRYWALEKIHTINDETIANIQLKKDFLNSMIQNGHNVSPLFVEQLKKLPDSKYKSFKEELVDTVLHSTTYNEKRRKYLQSVNNVYSDWLPGDYSEYFSPCAYPTIDKVKGTTLIMAYEDLQLIKSLDPKAHKDYLQSKIPQVKSLSNLIKNQMALDFTKKWQPKSAHVSNLYEHSREYLMKKLIKFYKDFLTEYPD